jgi:ABC-type multidrug transport system fused ATPase/permease subunit
MGEKFSRENEDSVQERYNYNKKVKIKRLKIGMILALVAGALFITCESFFAINQNWYNAEKQLVTNNYNQDLITSEEYNDIRRQQDLNRYLNIWLISIFSTISKLGVYGVSIFIIISLLSIILDESFNKKMRRISLGLAVLIVLFLLYPIIAGANTINNYYYGYWI